MRKLFYLFCLTSALGFLYIACNSKDNKPNNTVTADKEDDCAFLRDLTNDEKKLLDSLANRMRQTKKSSSELKNSTAYNFLNTVLRPKDFKPIDEYYAQQLGAQFNRKKILVERGSRRLMRMDFGGERDTRSVWIPTREFYSFVADLIRYEADHENVVTGIEMAFGSYPYDKARDDEREVGPSSRRTNGDSLSGRSTLYFLGTYDKTKEQLHYNVLNHIKIPKEITAFGIKSSEGDYFNHGTLCPDSCSSN